jgi:hypothetical protein
MLHVDKLAQIADQVATDAMTRLKMSIEQIESLHLPMPMAALLDRVLWRFGFGDGRCPPPIPRAFSVVIGDGWAVFKNKTKSK